MERSRVKSIRLTQLAVCAGELERRKFDDTFSRVVGNNRERVEMSIGFPSQQPAPNCVCANHGLVFGILMHVLVVRHRACLHFDVAESSQLNGITYCNWQYTTLVLHNALIVYYAGIARERACLLKS